MMPAQRCVIAAESSRLAIHLAEPSMMLMIWSGAPADPAHVAIAKATTSTRPSPA
jgi:hypothetical protein